MRLCILVHLFFQLPFLFHSISVSEWEMGNVIRSRIIVELLSPGEYIPESGYSPGIYWFLLHAIDTIYTNTRAKVVTRDGDWRHKRVSHHYRSRAMRYFGAISLYHRTRRAITGG